jgi:hypothetical protein
VCGELYNEFKNTKLNLIKLETEIKKLMQDEDVTKRSGIYLYILTRQERYLSIALYRQNEARGV